MNLFFTKELKIFYWADIKNAPEWEDVQEALDGEVRGNHTVIAHIRNSNTLTSKKAMHIVATNCLLLFSCCLIKSLIGC